MNKTLTWTTITMVFIWTSSIWAENWVQTASPPLWMGTLPLRQMDIQLWPEYDRPETLVIVRLYLPRIEAFPVQVTFPIPAEVEAHAVAEVGTDGQLYRATFQRVQGSPWSELIVQAMSEQIQIEYYMPMERRESHRQGHWQWPGGMDIGFVNLEIQHPKYSKNFKVDPPKVGERIEDQGLIYEHFGLGPLAKDQIIEMGWFYENPTHALSKASPLPPKAEAPELPQPLVVVKDQGPKPSHQWIYILGGVLLVIGIVGLLAWKRETHSRSV